jgi:hypothetical protein
VIWSAAPFAPALSKGADGWRGGFLAALYVGDADPPVAFVGQIVASTRHSWRRGRAIDYAPRFLL